MNSSRHSNRGGARTYMFVAALLVVGTGILAYKFVFHRAGEAAISLIPADSLVVATADLGPSPGQVDLFAHIAKSIIDEKADDPLESAASRSTNGAAYLKAIRPYLGMSYAFGCWKKPGAIKDDDVNYVGLAAVRSTSDVEAASAQHGVLEQSNGLSYYRISGEKMCVTTIRQYLVVSDDPAALLRIKGVANGDSASVASQRDYLAARAKLPSDANLMVFVNMNAASAATRAHLNILNSDAATVKGWFAGGATLRNNGLEIVWNGPVDQSNPLSRLVTSIKPIDTSLYSRLPAGAFGFFALAQPGAYYAAKNTNLGLTADQKRQFQTGIDSFERETGLNVERDIVTGLTGNVSLAIYPSNSASTEIPDGLILLDDSNGSDPATMVEKIKGAIANECRKNHSAVPVYRSEQRDGATIWTLDDETEKALRIQAGIEKRPGDSPGISAGINGVNVSSQGTNVHIGQGGVHADSGSTMVDVNRGGVLVTAPGTNVEIRGNGVNVNANGANVSIDAGGVHVNRAQPHAPNSVAEQKLLIFAVIDKSVIVASSRSLMDRAIASYNTGKSSLASDPAYTPMLKQITAGSQQVIMVNVPDIMEHLRHVLTSSMTDPNGPKPEDVIKLFGSQGNGLILSRGCADNRESGVLFIPIDYERAIHLIGLQRTARKDAIQ